MRATYYVKITQRTLARGIVCTTLPLCKLQHYQCKNLGLDGSSVDFTIGKGKVVPEYKISFVFMAKKKAYVKIFWTLKSRKVD